MNTVPTIPDDASLVTESLKGNLEAFGQIVARYQTLVCSVAYSGTGSFSQSEDLAQETFVSAWKQLRTLREPAKLKAWLCGIVRHRVYDTLKQQGREPSHAAEPLEAVEEVSAGGALPVDHTITKEEGEILWRALALVPEIYREPLVLFYREHQSVEAVAEKLELSEDNVKQRLSRGRKLLQEEVLSFVEGALARTSPGKAFTLAVLAAIPGMTMSAKAATLGAAAAKGSATAKAAGAMGLFGAVLSPVLMLLGNYASYRMSMDEARTDEERWHIRRLFRLTLVWTCVLSCLLAGPLFFMCRGVDDRWLFWELLFVTVFGVYLLALGTFAFASLGGWRRHMAEILAREHGGNFPTAAYEYQSRASLFGWPLLHVRIGDRFDVVRGPVKAWIAIGSNQAVGLIFASGGIAVAPISFGGIAIGLVPFGAVAMGLISMGAISVGGWAYGGLAIGWQVFGGCAVAWNVAQGSLALARDMAVGSIVHAAQVNTEAAKQFTLQNPFFRVANVMASHGFLTMLLWVVPVWLQARLVARARRDRELKGA